MPVDRVVERQPIVSPTVHTREVRTNTRVAYVDRVVERQPIVHPTIHTREMIHGNRSRKRKNARPLVCGRSKTLANEIAKAKRAR